MAKKVIIAMSGGVDSSTTAYKLLESGYDVVGATLQMGRFCDAKAVEDAKKVAETLKIKHFVIDIENKFKEKVTDYFIEEYLNGFTPNPCAKCNREVKFKELINFMQEQNADFIATGHYAKIINNNDIYELHRSDEDSKDQSYFLSTLKYEYLKYIIFPLELIRDKNEVREIARKIGLHISDKPDSQNACFLETDYKDFIKKNINLVEKKGEIKHISGKILGKHSGIINYTIGQRKGLKIGGFAQPIYVVATDKDTNEVIVGEEEFLYSSDLILKNINILDKNISENVEYYFKLRSTQAGQYGKIKFIEDNRIKIILNEGARAITKGQLTAIYKDTKVIASGWGV